MICKKCYATPAFLISGVLMLVAGALPAFGQGSGNNLCTQDAYNSYNGLTGTHAKTLSCTANDVRVSSVTSVSVINADGTITAGGKCVSGTTFSFIADFTIQTTSNATRSNIGIFFGTGASNITNDQALTGTCSDSILTPTYTKTTSGATPTQYTLGDPTYEELDTNGETQAGTACGDTSSTDGNGTGQQMAELEVDNVSCPLTALDPCPDPTITGTCMALPECTSWYQPTANIPVCNSTTHAWVPTAVPGTTSKCNCTTLYIPIQLVQPSATVAKTCTTDPTNAAKTTCDLGAEGGSEVYQVTITNTTPANEGGIIIDQICDNRYGSIYDDGTPTNRCPDGTIGHSFVTGTTCGAGTPGDISNGSSGSCTFTVSHAENLSVTDQVTVAGHSDITSSQTFNPPASNTVTVTSSDAPTTAKTNLGLEPGPVNACLTIRYDVTATNTSSADESVTLNSSGTAGQAGYVPALNTTNSFGDITSTHGDSHTTGSVTGTTCGVAGGSPGLGTLGTVNPVTSVTDCKGGTVTPCNGGAFAQMLAPGTGGTPTGNGGFYKCQFDGVICGVPGPIPSSGANMGSICTLGLQVQNTTVTPNLTGDDPSPNADTITVTANPFTAVVCLDQSGS